MGLLKKIFKPVAKVLDKVIPNEIKPVLPYLSAVAPFMLPAGFGAGFGSGIFNSSVAQQMAARGLLGAGLNIGSQLAQEGNEGDINLLRAGIAAVPAALSAPGAANFIRTGQTISGTPLSQVALEGGSTDLFAGGFGEGFKNVGLEALAKGSEFFGGAAAEGSKVFGPGEATLKGAATIAKGVTPSLTTEAGFEAAEYAKKALADYEKELAEFNALTAANKQASDMDRATAIYNSMTNAGAFTVDTIKETLGQLGLPSDFFAYGGRVNKAGGGLMNLKMGGMPAEIDARQSGGFIPIGKAERADDVPARLSQNEFVMTADAVRGMGQGNINLGAQRMYDIMKQYEPIGKALA